MPKNTSTNQNQIIIPAENGYKVAPFNYMSRDCALQEHVFETFDGLVAHLREVLPEFPTK